MLFDFCAECQRCCHVDEGYPPLEVTLTKHEARRHGSVCIESRCEHLGAQGCVLGDDKPFSCKLYPLSYNPETGRFYYDNECPLMPLYVQQLSEAGSDARSHFSAMTAGVAGLEGEDDEFLKRNFSIDADYFDLRELPFFESPSR